MHGLLGDRFLKRIARDLKIQRKYPMSKPDEQKPEIDEEKTCESEDPGSEVPLGNGKEGTGESGEKDHVEQQK